MRALEISNLLQIGATDRVRKYLKKLSLKDRLPVLQECIPYVNATKGTLDFFHKNFAKEIGAIIAADYDFKKAELLYRISKEMG
jgi:hypothetical protein